MAAPAEQAINWVDIGLTLGLAILTMIVGTVSTLFWRMIGGLATKEDLAKTKGELIEADHLSDMTMLREMETRIDGRHRENLDMLKELRDDVKTIMRTAYRAR